MSVHRDVCQTFQRRWSSRRACAGDGRDRHGCRRRRARRHADLRGLQRPPTRRAGGSQRRLGTAVVAASTIPGADAPGAHCLDDAARGRELRSDEALVVAAASSTCRRPARRPTSPARPAPDLNTARRRVPRGHAGSARQGGRRPGPPLLPHWTRRSPPTISSRTQARDAAIARADRGFGARWLAMNAHTLASQGRRSCAVARWGLFIVLFSFGCSRLSRVRRRGRCTAARAVRERADLEAGTAIVVKKVEVRAAIETMRAEQELASTRLELEAQTISIGRSSAIGSPQRSRHRRRCRRSGSARSSPSWRCPSRGVRESARVDRVTAGEKRCGACAAGRGGGGAGGYVRSCRRSSPARIDSTTSRCAVRARSSRSTEEIDFSLSAQSPRHKRDFRGNGEPAGSWIDATPPAQVKKTTTTRIDRPKRQARTEIHTSGGRRQSSVQRLLAEVAALRSFHTGFDVDKERS